MNSRGLKLFTCKWIPENQEPKALIFLCHGYAMECSITMNSEFFFFFVHEFYMENQIYRTTNKKYSDIIFVIGLGTATRLVKAGFAVYGIDYEGHGKSAGLQGLVNKFDNVVDDCSDHFTTICGQILLSVSSNLKKKSI